MARRCILRLTPEERITVSFALNFLLLDQRKRNMGPRQVKAALRVRKRIQDWLAHK